MADVPLQTIVDTTRQALDMGEADRAVSMASYLLQQVPQLIEGSRLLGEAYLNRGDAQAAISAFEDVLHADPENVTAYYGLGLAQQSLGRSLEAIQSFERALEIQPNLAELRTHLLRLYAETPNSAGQFRLSRSGLGRLYMRGQMYAQATSEFRAVLDQDPDRDDVCVALAETLWRDGQEDEAVAWCRTVVTRTPNLHKPTLILGYLLLAGGHPEGDALWRRAASQEPSLQTARQLFDILPPVRIEEPQLHPFDEQAWQAIQSQQTSTSTAIASQPSDTVSPSSTAQPETDAVQTIPDVLPSELSDDAFLASLLGLDDLSSEESAHTGLDTSSQTIKFEAPSEPESMQETFAVRADLESADDHILHEEPAIEDLTPQPMAEFGDNEQDDLELDDLQPFELTDLPEYDHASLGRIEPFSLDELILEDPTGDPPVASTAPDPTQPFYETPELAPQSEERTISEWSDPIAGQDETASLWQERQEAPDEGLRFSDELEDRPTFSRTSTTDHSVRPEDDLVTHSSISNPDITFSLSDLGLTDEELRRFGLTDEQIGWNPPTPSTAPNDEQETAAQETTPEQETTAQEMTPEQELSDPWTQSELTEPPSLFEPWVDGTAGLATPDTAGAELPELPESTDIPPSYPVAHADELERFRAQVEAEPENHAIRLAFARMSEQCGDIEQAIEQYRQLIRRGALLEPIAEDLADLTTGTYERTVLRRLHRLLGDTYMKQERMEEALREYSWA